MLRSPLLRTPLVRVESSSLKEVKSSIDESWLIALKQESSASSEHDSSVLDESRLNNATTTPLDSFEKTLTLTWRLQVFGSVGSCQAQPTDPLGLVRDELPTFSY